MNACADCRFFDMMTGMAATGECRRDPSPLVKNRNYWCGSFMPKEPELIPIDIIFAGMSNDLHFVEVEHDGMGIAIGEWLERSGDYHVLRLLTPPPTKEKR